MLKISKSEKNFRCSYLFITIQCSEYLFIA
nr:MAG TPA: hypothetical protein [Caudoviricetes sp.]